MGVGPPSPFLGLAGEEVGAAVAVALEGPPADVLQEAVRAGQREPELVEEPPAGPSPLRARQTRQ